MRKFYSEHLSILIEFWLITHFLVLRPVFGALCTGGVCPWGLLAEMVPVLTCRRGDRLEKRGGIVVFQLMFAFGAFILRKSLIANDT